MNYYIQGNKEKADQIKAAFNGKGIYSNCNFANENYLYYQCDGKVAFCFIGGGLANIIKTHPDYKELKLPIEPKFKVGDWITCVDDDGDTSTEMIEDFWGDKVRLIDCDGVFTLYPKSELKQYHLWYIQDAKDGDVLVTTKIRSCPFIYRKTDIENNLAHYYAGIDGNGDFSEGCLKGTLYHFGLVSDVVPATKKQRDLLFAKMKEAGYTWDEKKKELRKIIEPKFKVGDDIETGNTIETIAEVDHATCRYYCESGRTIYFANQNLWHFVPKKHYAIANFRVGMPVLVRNGDCLEWEYVTFSHYRKVGTPFCAGGQYWFQCIPFSEDTKHLLGTTDMPSEEYINW